MTDVPDLPWNELAAAAEESELAELADAVDEVEKPTGPPVPDRKLHFRAWLWLQLNTRTKFRNVAKLVLSGGPDGVWVNKPLQAEYVLKDIEQFYATNRQGVTAEIVTEMREAVKHFRANPEWTEKLVAAKLSTSDKTQEKRLYAQLAEIAETAMSDDTDESVRAAGDFEAVPDDPDRPITTVSRRDPFAPGTLIPKVRCKWSGRTRTYAWQCGRDAVMGHEMCELHGGTLIEPEEIKNLLRAGQERLVMASEVAITTVIDIMENGVNESTRLKAAEMVLDRTGFQAGIEVSFAGAGGAGGPSNADILRDRLLALAGHNDITVTVEKTDIEDAEVVSDSAEETESN